MKKFLTIYLLLILFFVLSANMLLAEESKGEVEGDASVSSDTSDIELEYPWSEETDFGGLVSRFYNIALGLVGVAALGAIIYGGILWTVSKTPSGSQEARDWITGAISGLLLLLGAYLLFNTIGIIKEGKLVEPDITEVETETPEESTEAQPDAYSDPGARQLLKTTTEDKIGVNKSESEGTSLNGVRRETMSGLFQIWEGCGKCEILITGGTEGGIHALGDFSHTNGYKLDLSYANSSQQLNDYLRNQIPEFQIDYNKTYLGKDGNKYRLEEEDGIKHWDICFKCN